MRPGHPELQLGRIQAVVFHTNGVITDTVRVRARAWKRAFDEFLRRRGRQTGTPQELFAIREDYLRYVDGRPSLDGVRTFLDSRGIALPEGTEADDERADTARALVARMTTYFLDEVDRSGVVAFGSSVALLRELRRRGAGVGVVSVDRSCARVLEAAHVDRMTDVRVDGNDVADLGLADMPDPAVLSEACRRLHTAPVSAAAVQNLPVGVEAASRAGFGLVIGLDRAGGRESEFYRQGAHVVVRDLAEVEVKGQRPRAPDTSPRGAGRSGLRTVPERP